jgi:MFS family permease
MKAFRLIWFGQFVSIFGSEMTTFALAIWVWQETGQVTALALLPVFNWLPGMIFGPIAGALVDRLNRRLVLMLSDGGSAAMTLALLLLYTSGNLQIWHLYVATAVASLFESFQWPAFSATISLMVDKKDYSRANGMMSLAESTAMILAPVAGATLIAFVSIGDIFFIDILTFLVALTTLLIVAIPEPRRDEAPEEAKLLSLWADTWYGFVYILRRPGLLGIQLLLFAYNFVKSFGFAVLVPMVLARSGENTLILGAVQSATGIGAVVGGLILSVWAGTRRQIYGVLRGIVLASLFTQILFGLASDVVWWCAFAFIGTVFRPWINAANQAIWQRKVPPAAQGRVFGARATIALIALPLGYLLAGPLADRVFEPAMMPGGAWAELFAPLVGVGPGSGMALMTVGAGVITALMGMAAYFIRPIREVEILIPDHDLSPKKTQAAVA